MTFEAPHSVVGRWVEDWDPIGFKTWALRQRKSILPHELTLGLVFVESTYREAASEIVDVLRNSLGIPTLLGCVAAGTIVNDREYERKGGIALGLYSLPGAILNDFAFSSSMAKDAAQTAEQGFWRRRFEPGSEGVNSWLVLVEPLHVDIERWLSTWRSDFPDAPVFGGVSHIDINDQSSFLIWNDTILENGGVALGLGGGVRIRGLTAQGCSPIGDSWTVTKAHENVLDRIGNRPAFSVMDDTFSGLSDEDRIRSRGHLFAGFAVNEYQSEFGSGDFIIRNILGSDRNTGEVSVGAYPRVGQTVQFQIRDGEAASLELRKLLDRQIEELGEKRIYGACVCDCSGRGWSLFGVPHHDASIIYPKLRRQGLVGFFGNGEFGPINGKSFVHGYTCSLAVFAEA